eukprot:TCONS_00009880-protein
MCEVWIRKSNIFYRNTMSFLDAEILVKYLRNSIGTALTDASIETTCESYQCSSGWEQSRGKRLKQFTKWNFEYGFTCKQCQRNFVKLNKGNDEKCQKCPRYHLSNIKHDKCFDPYRQEYLVKSTIYFTAFGLAGFNLAFCVLILIIFIIYHKTPIVKISDFILTVIHLFTSILINAVSVILPHTKPRKFTCFFETIVAGNLYTFFIAIVLMKSHDCFQFNAKIVNKKQTKHDSPAMVYDPHFDHIFSCFDHCCYGNANC